MQIPRGKVGKTLIAEVSRLIRLFNSSKRCESVATGCTCFKYFCHYYSRSHHTNKKKQRTRQILEQKNGMVETWKARRTDLRV